MRLVERHIQTIVKNLRKAYCSDVIGIVPILM